MRGKERFSELLEKYKERPILLYGDPDVDGLYSLFLMCEFAEMLGLSYKYHVNGHRKHGFLLDPSRLKGYLVIASDFSIPYDQVQEIVNNDIVLLSTDHHEVQSEFIECFSEKNNEGVGIVINNQYPFEPEENRYLSGAGVFYELVCDLYPEFKTSLRDGLVGITLLSDMRSTEGDLAKAYLRKTFAIDTENGYGSYVMQTLSPADFSFGMPKFDRNFIDYTFSPTVNALLRYNQTDKAVQFILGYGLERGESYRRTQQSLVATMRERCRLLSLANVDFLFTMDTDYPEYPGVDVSDFIGLLCSDWKSDHDNKSTFGFTLSNGSVERSSFRGKCESNVPYLRVFRNNGLNAQGHQNAFGIIDFEPSQEIFQAIDDAVGEVEQDYVDTRDIIDVTNLAMIANKQIKMRDGQLMSLYEVAQDNCYVRDNYRHFLRYLGTNYKIVKETYRMEEFDETDILNNVEPDRVKSGVRYKYVRDSNGEPIPKYIEYVVDGRKVKSFGTRIEEAYIMPILERGYLEFQLRARSV